MGLVIQVSSCLHGRLSSRMDMPIFLGDEDVAEDHDEDDEEVSVPWFGPRDHTGFSFNCCGACDRTFEKWDRRGYLSVVG